MLFPVHKGLGISPNIEQSVVKVLVSHYPYLAALPPAKRPVSSKRIARLELDRDVNAARNILTLGLSVCDRTLALAGVSQEAPHFLWGE